LSDLESVYWNENGRWTEELEQLKQVDTKLDDSYDFKVITPILRIQAEDYKKSMVKYRYRVLTYRDGNKCSITAKPLDYGGKTRLSFAISCTQSPGKPTPFAKDTNGGDIVSPGSHSVIATPQLVPW
jgi:hypothetical protein